MTQNADSDAASGDGQATERHALEEGLAGLARAAAALGANTLAVLILDAGTLEIAHRRTAAGESLPLSAPVPCGPEARAAFCASSGPVIAENSLAKFLTAAVAPEAHSFLLFPWHARQTGITIAFGFEGRQSACASLPEQLTESINLASLAAWSLNEVSRLRAELRRANDRYAGRKLVERAKSLLQSERGMNEQQAYEYLRRLSRQRRVPLSKLAENLLGAARWP